MTLLRRRTARLACGPVEQFPTNTGDLPAFLLNHVEVDEPRALPHIARHDPARVLADVEAKRRIVERFAQGKAEWAAACEDYSDWAAGTPSRAGRATTSVSRDGLNELARVLRLLALPYADHPDYDEGDNLISTD